MTVCKLAAVMLLDLREVSPDFVAYMHSLLRFCRALVC
jgi:hypothetical protein